MKKKELINLIKTDSTNVQVPNLSANIIEGMNSQKYFKESIVEEEVKNKRKFSFKLFARYAVSFIVLLFVGIFVFSITNNNDMEKVEISEIDKTYASQIITLTNVAGQYTLNETPQELTYKKLSSKQTDSLETIGNTLNQYVSSVESLFQKDSCEYELYLLDEEYEYMLLVENGAYEYTILYNEIEENGNTQLNGVIKTSLGKFEFVSNIIEKENECDVTVELFVNERNSFVLSQEIINDENVYNIAYKYNNKIFTDFTLKTLFDEDSKKVQLIIDEYTEFVFEKTSNGYSVDYKFLILTGNLKIEETENQYIYSFNDFKFSIDK